MTKARPMTEAEWLHCTSPYVMLRYLQQHYRVTRVPGGRRRLRLFCCACCRQIWYLIPDERSRRAVEAAERFADGQIRKADLAAAHQAAEAVHQAAERQVYQSRGTAGTASLENHRKLVFVTSVTKAPMWTAAHAFAIPSANIVSMSAANAQWITEAPNSRPEADARQRADQIQARLLRCIFGNPFRPVLFDPSWLE